MQKEYVFPHFKKQEDEIKKIKGISRLFAYPKAPHFENGGKKVILDSGAFGLSLQGRKINKNHMEKLDKHYRKYARENTLCIAPDEFLNPMQSMMNIRKWYKNGYYPYVTAVLQCTHKRRIDLDNLKYQAKFYSNFTDEFCFSNNDLTGEMAKMLNVQELFRYMKEELKVKWIHVLGAGWNLEDINNWLDVDYFDSMDSIAYYTSTNGELGGYNAIDNIRSIYKQIKGSDLIV